MYMKISIISKKMREAVDSHTHHVRMRQQQQEGNNDDDNHQEMCCHFLWYVLELHVHVLPVRPLNALRYAYLLK